MGAITKAIGVVLLLIIAVIAVMFIIAFPWLLIVLALIAVLYVVYRAWPSPKREWHNRGSFVGRHKVLSVIGVFLLLFVSLGCVNALTNLHSSTTENTATPTAAVVSTTPTATHKAPTATPTATINVPKATPSSRPQRLTQAQLNAGEAALQKRGNTITEHIHYDHADPDGTLVYLGKMTNENGYAQNIIIYVYKDFPSATDGFSDAVTKLETLGFDGSYSGGYTWTGTMLYHGQAVGGGAVQSSSDSPPYMVTVFFLE